MEFLCRSLTFFFSLSTILVFSVKSASIPNGEPAPAARGGGAEEREGVLMDMRVMMGYSDSWAVEVKGGESEADKIAKENGFVNLGQVSRDYTARRKLILNCLR